MLFAQLAVTTCALVYFIHKVTEYLENNYYVRVLCIDFSKAFDVMNNVILIPKRIALGLPNNIINWIISCLSDLKQVCVIKFDFSNPARIDTNIIKGSGVGS